jgi:hypothetical protein
VGELGAVVVLVLLAPSSSLHVHRMSAVEVLSAGGSLALLELRVAVQVLEGEAETINLPAALDAP